MKWAAIIVALMVGGTLVWAMFFRGSPAGTPYATAEAYVAAALKNDSA